ncbi:uncharacterized protein VNE69_06194 [Vairimorpha necatrix]|uniref:Uncharacterized protein n=1 Tax=Vairimorpha necatrix TaxID=6039 RepID=A0AAX4JD44_9MICR
MKDHGYEFIKDPETDEYIPEVEKYVDLIKNVDNLRSKRESIINRHFYELYNYNIDKLEDRDGRISRIIGKTFTYPNSFLASSLGFNRTTWAKKYEEILGKFDLSKKLQYQTLRNMVLFEKLKLLIIKYNDIQRKE